MKTTTMWVPVVAITALIGCQTPGATPHDVGCPESQNVNATVIALSNEFARLSERLESLEREWGAFSPSAELVQEMMDEARYEPIVHEKIIVIMDDEKRVTTNGAPALR